nr:hypothetical protein VITISV_044320 [Tanacetum cinerariifolium]
SCGRRRARVMHLQRSADTACKLDIFWQSASAFAFALSLEMEDNDKWKNLSMTNVLLVNLIRSMN